MRSKDQANIKADELRALRKAARVYLSYSEEKMTAIVQDKALIEIFNPSTVTGDRHGKGI